MNVCLLFWPTPCTRSQLAMRAPGLSIWIKLWIRDKWSSLQHSQTSHFCSSFQKFSKKISRFIQTVKSQGWWAFVVLRTFLKSFIQIQIDKLHPQLFIFFSLKFRSRTTTFCRLMIESIHKLFLSFHWFRLWCLN